MRVALGTALVALSLTMQTGHLAVAQTQLDPARSQTDSGKAPTIEQLSSLLMLDAVRVRQATRSGSSTGRALGERFWVQSKNFVDSVATTTRDNSLYVPILESLHSTTEEELLRPGSIDMNALARVTGSIEEQARLASGLGIFQRQRPGLDIEVRATDRSGKSVNGLYVWIDLICCVKNGRSANPLLSVTSPARARVIPGMYLVRLIDGANKVTERSVMIGSSGQPSEKIDLVVR